MSKIWEIKSLSRADFFSKYLSPYDFRRWKKYRVFGCFEWNRPAVVIITSDSDRSVGKWQA